MGFSEGRGDVCNRAEEDERVVLRGHKASTLPEAGGFVIDGVDHQSASSDQIRGLNTPLERVLDKAGPDPLPGPGFIRGKLTEEKARHGVRRLAGADRAWQDRRHYGGRRQTVVSNHAPSLVYDEYDGKTLLLIG